MRLVRGFRLPWYAFVLVLALHAPAQAASDSLNLNRYYRYPLAIEAGLQPLNHFSEQLGAFTIAEISGRVVHPLQSHPLLQPMLRLGAITVTDPTHTWNHRHYFGGPGFALSNRISKEFEIGGEVFGAASLAVFPGAAEGGEDDQGEAVGSPFLIAGGSLTLRLNASYNLSIGISPSVRWFRNTGGMLSALDYGSLTLFDGAAFGVGFSASYRFGRDPDTPQAPVRALRLVEAPMPPVFAAMQSYYAVNPLTTIELTNTESAPLVDVEFSFYQAGFMDSPTRSAVIPEIAPGETVTVPILASYNREVFSTNGITPLTGEMIATYTHNRRAAEQRWGVTYDLYDRNAMTWDDDRKVAAFITPADGSVRNYGSYVRNTLREQDNGFLSTPLQAALQTYAGLTELGIGYQVDPASPFTAVQKDALAIDDVSLARDTLVRGRGDCDDLTVLFNTILETLGVRTGFVTTPGHIYSAVNTGEPARQWAAVHPDREMTLEVDDELWVLVEVTLLGRSGFLEAWHTGMQQWRQYDTNPGARGFYLTAAAQQVYRPVGLTERDLGLQYGDPGSLGRAYAREFSRFADAQLRPLEDAAATGDPRQWNRLGIRAAQLGRTDLARTALNRAAALDRTYIDPRVNLGSVHFVLGEYRQALGVYTEAYNLLGLAARPRPVLQGTVLLNISRTQYELGNFAAAEEFYEAAIALAPQEAEPYGFIAGAAADGGARASEAAAGAAILFADEGVADYGPDGTAEE